MQKYALHVATCAAVFVVAVAVRVLLHWPSFLEYFPYFLWVHVAIIALAFYGFWALRRSPKPRSGETPSRPSRLPPMLIALAVPVMLASAPIASLPFKSLGTTPDGAAVYRKSWTVENGRHYVVLNRTTKVEITPAEHLESERELMIVFASAWVLFSYVVLLLWHYVWRREHAPNAA